MIELVELEWVEVYTTNPADVKSGLYSWHRVKSEPNGFRSIYFKPDRPAAEVDFLIQYNTANESPCFMVSSTLRWFNKLESALNPNGGYLATVFYATTKEQFISIMIESNHSCLDWLLFNQDIWNT